MKINNADNFTHIIVKLLKGLNYENIKETNPVKTGFDIVAEKDGVSYCFKCQYDMDAISEKKMTELCEAYKDSNYDKAVFVTNSSCISAAKKKGESEGILLWDRNTVDRLAIGISESLEDKVVPQKGNKGLAIAVMAAVAALVIAVIVYFAFFR